MECVLTPRRSILDSVVSRFPGGAHDSYILQNSTVGVHLERGDAGDAWIIGKYLCVIVRNY